MKAKRSKAHKKTFVRKKSKSSTRKKTSAIRRTTRPVHKRIAPPPIPSTPTLGAPDFKICEEPEVGDIGGFGDVDAFESHEKQCGEKATEFCATCNKNLCSSHYELMHREHNAGGQHSSGQSLTQ